MSLQTGQFFKCLADDTRLRCLMLLLDRPALCVCDLHEALAISQPKVSRHLADLRHCGLVLDERHGRWIYYRLHPDLPSWAVETIRLSRTANQASMAECEARLSQLPQCEDAP